MTQNKPGGIVTLAAETQQILVQTQRQIEFAAVRVIARLPKRNLHKLRRGTQLLPQLSCPGVGMACFRRGQAFDGEQRRTQGTAKFELLSLTFRVLR